VFCEEGGCDEDNAKYSPFNTRCDQLLENSSLRVVADVHHNPTEIKAKTELKMTTKPIRTSHKRDDSPSTNSNPDAIETIETITITNEQKPSHENSTVLDVIEVETVEVLDDPDSVLDDIEAETVEVLDNPAAVKQSQFNRWNSTTSGAGHFEEKSLKLDFEDLKMKQLFAAKRSLETNLFLISLFAFIFLSIILLPKREFYTIIVFSTMKGSLPIFTTMANFGTIQTVFSDYKSSFEKELSIYVLRISKFFPKFKKSRPQFFINKNL
jgi:hypothetical protein